MKMLLPICLLGMSANICLAEKNTDLAFSLAIPRDGAFSDNFDRDDLGKGWAVAKGDWKIVDGVLVGRELAADKHAAVASCQRKNRDSVVRLSFKLDGSTNGFNFSLNHAKGHLFRVIVAPSGLIVRTDKDKKDATIKSELIGQSRGKFEAGKWYTLQVEMVGNKVVATTDNDLKVSGQHARLNTDKPNYRLVMKGDSLSIDDLKIWAPKS